MSDLDTRLRTLGELSPPSRSPLGADELHQRANRVQRRSLAVRVVPAVIVVLALAAGAAALRGTSTTTDVVVGDPDTPTVPDGAVATVPSSLSERDQQLVDFLSASAELRHQLDREAVLTAVFAASSGSDGGPELQTQRAATDAALAQYQQQITTGDPARESPALADAIQQAENRLTRIGTSRQAVDQSQSDAYGLLDGFTNTAASVAEIPRQYLVEVDQPDLFRGVLTASNLGTYAMTDAAWASSLTVAIQIGYYPEITPKGADPTTGRGTCATDAAGAGEACPAYADALRLHADGDQAMAEYQRFATGEQKLILRAADAGSDYEDLVRAAFEDGVGINDLRGWEPNSVPIDPVAWRAIALDHLDRLAAAERQLYDLLRSGGSDPRSTPSAGSGSSPGTPPSTAVLDAEAEATTTSSATPTTGAPQTEIIETGRSTTERVTSSPTPPGTTSRP